MNAIVVNRLLGGYSLALGALEVAAPKALSRNLGLPGGATLVRSFGFRELFAGGMIMGKPWSPSGPWSRVAGDAMDLAALALALNPRNKRRGSAAIATLLVAGVTALDIACAVTMSTRDANAGDTARRTRYIPKVDASGGVNGTQPTRRLQQAPSV